jgi:uncharacterized protein
MPLPIMPFFYSEDSGKAKEVTASRDESKALVSLWDGNQDGDVINVPDSFDRMMLTSLKAKGLVSYKDGNHIITVKGKKFIRNHVLSSEVSTFDQKKKAEKFVFASSKNKLNKASKENSGPEVRLISIASNSIDQSFGLKYVKSIGENEGMLFKFQAPKVLSFWMENTYVPLDIAFIDNDQTIKQIDSMVPMSTQSHKSKDKCVYALEVPKGFFAKHGISVGSKIIIDDEGKTVKFDGGNI